MRNFKNSVTRSYGVVFVKYRTYVRENHMDIEFDTIVEVTYYILSTRSFSIATLVINLSKILLRLFNFSSSEGR